MERRFALRRLLAPAMAALALPAFAACCAAGLDRDEVARETERIAAVLNLAPGATVADVGAGNGRFSVPLARRVGESGRVFATEVDENDLADLRQRLEEEGVANVTVVEGTQRDTGLPAGCCDAILLRRVYHHFTDPEAMQRSLLAALRPGGVLAAIDFEPNSWQPPAGVPERDGGHGVSADDLIAEMTAAGFEVVRRVEDWQGEGHDYCILFRRARTAEDGP